MPIIRMQPTEVLGTRIRTSLILSRAKYRKIIHYGIYMDLLFQPLRGYKSESSAARSMSFFLQPVVSAASSWRSPVDSTSASSAGWRTLRPGTQRSQTPRQSWLSWWSKIMFRTWFTCDRALHISSGPCRFCSSVYCYSSYFFISIHQVFASCWFWACSKKRSSVRSLWALDCRSPSQCSLPTANGQIECLAHALSQ